MTLAFYAGVIGLPEASKTILAGVQFSPPPQHLTIKPHSQRKLLVGL